MIKNNSFFVFIVLVMCAFNIKARTHSVDKIKPNVINKEISQNGVKLTYQHIEAPAYFRVLEGYDGNANCYCDYTFVIDWPLTLNGKKVPILQNKLLDYLTEEYFVQHRPNNIEELVEERTRCYYYAERINSIPKCARENCQYDILMVSIYRFNHNMISFELKSSTFDGLGAHGGYTDYTYYINYDLQYNRVLDAATCFLPGVKDLIAKELYGNYRDELDEDNLFVPDNFKIDDNSITFFYPNCTIAPCVIWNISATIPIEDILKYASYYFKALFMRISKNK